MTFGAEMFSRIGLNSFELLKSSERNLNISSVIKKPVPSMSKHVQFFDKKKQTGRYFMLLNGFFK